LYDVVHVNSTYDKGGTGIIAKNLHYSLLRNELRSPYIFGYNGTFHNNYDESSVGLSDPYTIKFTSSKTTGLCHIVLIDCQRVHSRHI